MSGLALGIVPDHNLIGVVSTPLWNSEKSKFAGMFTVQDIIHLIQYYYHIATYETVAADVETVRLEALRGMTDSSYLKFNIIHERASDIEKTLGVPTPPLLSDHPSASLYGAAKRLIQTHARRLPLLDLDTETGHEVIVSVLTTYRLLKFISINVRALKDQLFLRPTMFHSAREKSNPSTCPCAN